MPTSPYYATKDGYILRASDGALIPQDPTNDDYNVYAAWVAAGNTAPVYVPPQG